MLVDSDGNTFPLHHRSLFHHIKIPCTHKIPKGIAFQENSHSLSCKAVLYFQPSLLKIAAAGKQLLRAQLSLFQIQRF